MPNKTITLRCSEVTQNRIKEMSDYNGCSFSETIRNSINICHKKYTIDRFGYTHRSKTDPATKEPSKYQRDKMFIAFVDALNEMTEDEATIKLREIGYLKEPKKLDMPPDFVAKNGDRWMRFVVGMDGAERALMNETVELVDDDFKRVGDASRALSWQLMIDDIKSKKLV